MTKYSAEIDGLEVTVESENVIAYIWAIVVDGEQVAVGGESTMAKAKAEAKKAKVADGEQFIAKCSEVVESETVENVDSSTKTLDEEAQPIVKVEPLESLKESDESYLIQSAKDTEYMAGSLWRQTGIIITKNQGQFENAKKKEMSAAFAKLLDKNVHPSLVPETGPDRKGEIITLRKKSGAVKWSSWEVTARLVQNCSTIFTGIEKLTWEQVFPGGYLISRTELDKLLKALDDEKEGEAPYKTVMRCLEMASKKLAEIEDLGELAECDPFVKDILDAFKQQLEDLKDQA